MYLARDSNIAQQPPQLQSFFVLKYRLTGPIDVSRCTNGGCHDFDGIPLIFLLFNFFRRIWISLELALPLGNKFCAADWLRALSMSHQE
jgi:hypothetical protein